MNVNPKMKKYNGQTIGLRDRAVNNEIIIGKQFSGLATTFADRVQDPDL